MRGERLTVSLRFHAAVKSAILRIERNAFQDESDLARLVHEDHRRRQRLLIEKQIDKAFRLREFYENLDAVSADAERDAAAAGGVLLDYSSP